MPLRALVSSPLLLLTSVLLGCGDPPTMAVAVHARGASFVAVQPAGGDWQAVAVPGDGEATASVAEGPFAILSVCRRDGVVEQDIQFVGPSTTELDVRCWEPPATTVHVSLSAPSTVRASVGRHPLNVALAADVVPGTYDVLVHGRYMFDGLFEIHRGVSIEADTVISVDLGQTGADLEYLPVTTDARSGEVVTGGVILETVGGGSLGMPSSLTRDGVLRVPTSALLPGDRQTVYMHANRMDQVESYRSAQRALTSESSLSLALPPGLSSVSTTWGSTVRVSWETTGAWTSGRFTANASDRAAFLWAQVTPEWIDATGSFSSIELPGRLDLPGWDASWTLLDRDLSWELSVERRLSDRDIDEAYQHGNVAATAP